MKLRIITPKQVVFEDEIAQITLPSAEGEITILSKHVSLFAMLKEGVVTVQHGKDETLFSIGGGYVETDGKEVSLLVSRAHGQDDIDEAEVKKAKQSAEQLLSKQLTEQERKDALQLLRRSTVDLQLLSKIKRRRSHTGAQ